jgi:hypothetical protein
MKGRKILHGSFIGLLVLMLFGCGSAPSKSASAAGMDLDAAIKEAATQMETRIPSGTMVALVSVASPSTAFSTQVLTRLESAIVSGGKLVVVDRANLDKVRAEQGFQLSGEVDDESAKSIGKLLGAGAIVTGSLTDLGDVYSLTLKAINIETATVSVSYLADLTKTTRIETLLATRGGAAQATTVRTQPATSSASTTVTNSTAPVRFTVTYNANGANGRPPSAQTVQNGESITIPDISGMTNARGTFGGWNTRADGKGTPYTAGDTFIVNVNIQLFAQWIEKVYNIGDRGPAGGWIFFDMGFYIDSWRYLEAAPQDIPSRLEWGNVGNIWDLSLGNKIGDGKQNTQTLVSRQQNLNVNNGAAQVVDAATYGGYDDWFLPSQEELDMMYQNLKRKGIGNLSSGIYISSSHTGTIFPTRSQNFTDGRVSNDSTGLVRAVRRF